MIIQKQKIFNLKKVKPYIKAKNLVSFDNSKKLEIKILINYISNNYKTFKFKKYLY